MRQHVPGSDCKVTQIGSTDACFLEPDNYILIHLRRFSRQPKRSTPTVEPEYLLADLMDTYPAICHQELQQGYLDILALLQEWVDDLNARYPSTTSLELEQAMDQFEKEAALLNKHLPPRSFKHDLKKEASKIEELVHKEVREAMAYETEGLALFGVMDREIERLLRFLERKYRIKYIQRMQFARDTID